MKRSNYISPVLAKLHWLPVKKRIQFKIATITCKVIQHKQPSYLLEILQTQKNTTNLRSSSKRILNQPFLNLEHGADLFLMLKQKKFKHEFNVRFMDYSVSMTLTYGLCKYLVIQRCMINHNEHT